MRCSSNEKIDTTIRGWDRMYITVRISRVARLRLLVGILLIKLAVVVIGCGLKVIETETTE